MRIKRNKNEEEYEKIDRWLKEYARVRLKEKKTKYKAMIVAKMLPVIKRIARTIARRSYDPIEDLVQAGCIGVLRAVEKFTFDAGVEFRVYAGHLIIGEMRHYLRDKLQTIRVPGHIQELMYRITTFTDSLTTEEFNDLTSYEIALATNIPKQKVDFVLMVERRTNVISTELVNYENGANQRLTFEQITPYENYKEMEEIDEIRFMLDNVIKYLPPDSKEIIELYYYKDMAQNEIADVLNVTPMTVSRRLKKAFDLLYDMIADNEMHREEDNDKEEVVAE